MNTRPKDSDEMADVNSAQDQVDQLKAISMLLLREIENLKHNREDFESKLRDRKKAVDFADEVQKFEESIIRAALITTSGSQIKAAELLTTKLTTLNAKIKRYKIDLRKLSDEDKK